MSKVVEQPSFYQVYAHHPELRPETVFTVGTFPITNGYLMSWLIIFLFLAIALYVKRKSSLVPQRLQLMTELAVGLVGDTIHSITHSKKAVRILLPIVGTVFLFVLVSNLLGTFIPGLLAITYNNVFIFRMPTNDFNMTIALAVSMSLLTHVMSIAQSGVFSHLGKFIPLHKVVVGFKAGISAGLLSLVDIFIGIMEAIGELAKLVSLSMRLFGNLYAGEMMAAVLYGLFAVAIPSVWLAMTFLGGAVQAAVFAMLTTVFYALMVEQGHH